MPAARKQIARADYERLAKIANKLGTDLMNLGLNNNEAFAVLEMLLTASFVGAVEVKAIKVTEVPIFLADFTSTVCNNIRRWDGKQPLTPPAGLH